MRGALLLSRPNIKTGKAAVNPAIRAKIKSQRKRNWCSRS